MTPIDVDGDSGPMALRDKVSGVLAAALPGYLPGEVRLLGAGTDHESVLVDDTLVLRLPSGTAGEAGPGLGPAAEAALLESLGGQVSVPVPTVVFARDDCLAYRLLPGRSLVALGAGVGQTDRRLVSAVVAGLGSLLAELHLLPPSALPTSVPADRTVPAQLVPDAIRSLDVIGGDLSLGDRRRAEDILREPPAPGEQILFSHQDLGVEHVLTDGRMVTGVIDWSDSAFGDPARDFGLLLRDLGPDAFDLLCRRYVRAGGRVRVDDEFVAHCRFTAVCGLLEDWSYGLTPGREPYAEKSRFRVSDILRG